VVVLLIFIRFRGGAVVRFGEEIIFSMSLYSDRRGNG
jgi:hypothetical protein